MSYKSSKKLLVSTVLCCIVFEVVDSWHGHHKPKPYLVRTMEDSMNYLAQYGYLAKHEELDYNDYGSNKQSEEWGGGSDSGWGWGEFETAITRFQKYAGLPVTGHFDEATKAKMNIPRCGSKDVFDDEDKHDSGYHKRSRRFIVAQGQSWKMKEVTYAISEYPDSGFPGDLAEKEITRAFLMWSNVTNLNFKKADSTDGEADIEIRFARRFHGDDNDFEGLGGAIAHAYAPSGEPEGGNVHFDDEEEWTSESAKGHNFFSVAVHEIGHALGLRHSQQKEAVMFAFPQPYNSSFGLSQDDIDGIQSIYGIRKKKKVLRFFILQAVTVTEE